MFRTLFLINPRSGPRRNPEAIRRAIERHGVAEWQIRSCAPPLELDAQIDAAESEGFDVVCAVGGDGTVSEIGRRLLGRALALGIVPTGSGNGFARHLGIPLDAAGAIRALAQGHVDTVDTAMVNGISFLGVCGTGFDALVAHRFAESAARGLRTYVRVGLRAWMESRESRFRLTVDGREEEIDAFVVAVANSSQYGNDARIAPLASLQDGLLDVVVVRNPPLVAAPFVLRRLFSGTLQESRHVRVVQGRAVTIDRAADGPAHVDGEPLMLPARLELAIRPRSLRVVVPAGTSRL